MVRLVEQNFLGVDAAKSTVLNVPSRISLKQANFQVFRLGPSLNRLAGGFFFLNYISHSFLERCGLAGLAGSLAGDLAGDLA